MSVSSSPQILTRSVLPSLLNDLDASDVLECYSLARNAPLHLAAFNVTVQKMAVGLRYDPPSNSRKPPLELTLEYGPQRMGEKLEEESMPILNQEGYVTWENEAKIYYTTSSIQSLSWKSAYYMSSLTGAVLQKVLDRAAQYSSLKPRYQPFAVYNERNKLLLKSSSSSDFVWNMWSTMADLGVDLRPILPPPMYTPRLFVTSLKKVSGYDEYNKLVPVEAARFYKKWSDCYTAIGLQDYSVYTPSPSASPTQAPTPIPTVPFTTDEPTAVDVTEDDNQEATTDEPEGTDAPTSAGSFVTEEGIQPVGSPTTLESVTDPPTAAPQTPLPTKNRRSNVQNEKDNERGDESDRWRRRRLDDTTPATIEVKDEFPAPDDTQAPVASGADADQDDVFMEDLQPMHETNTTLFPTSVPSEDATSSTENATQSAEIAVDAAVQEFADSAKNQAMMENLLSGDGDLMTLALTECWTNPMYGITDENSTSFVAYLYLDGNYFYRLNMTTPYMDVMKLERTIPLPPLRHGRGSGDVVDWVLAFSIIAIMVLGFFVLLQQLGALRIAFVRVQKWFFNPTQAMDDTSSHHTIGEGIAHSYGVDAIPLSMGGQTMKAGRKSNLVLSSQCDTSVDSHDGDLEMVETHGDDPDLPSMGSMGSSGSLQQHNYPPDRFQRHPDLVDLPNLRSSSKVAQPVTSLSLEFTSVNGSRGSHRM